MGWLHRKMYLLLVFLSLIGSCLAGLFGRYLGPIGSGFITTSCLFLSLLISFFVFYEVALIGCPVYIKLITWISSEVLNVDWGFMFDSLTVIMCVVVTFVSSLVHLYSLEYMSHDPHLSRFMSYLSLFTFFMLILVTADNFVQMFVGWEGVGLCSYLLINFWFTRIQANKAAIKAMILNRIGDFSLLIGIFVIYMNYKALDYATVSVLTPFLKSKIINFLNFDFNLLTVIGVFLFLGAVGKSAQLGLHSADKSFRMVKIIAQCIGNCSIFTQLPKSLQSVSIFFFIIVLIRNKDESCLLHKSGLVEFVCARKAVFWTLKPSIDVSQPMDYQGWYLFGGKPLGSFSKFKYAKYQP